MKDLKKECEYVQFKLPSYSELYTYAEEILKLAVKRMLPGGPLAKKQMSKLKIYRGNKHPHEVQNPKEISLDQMNKKNLLRN